MPRSLTILHSPTFQPHPHPTKTRHAHKNCYRFHCAYCLRCALALACGLEEVHTMHYVLVVTSVTCHRLCRLVELTTVLDLNLELSLDVRQLQSNLDPSSDYYLVPPLQGSNFFMRKSAWHDSFILRVVLEFARRNLCQVNHRDGLGHSR